MKDSDNPPEIGYEQAWAAYQAGQKLHMAGNVYLVRAVLSSGSPAAGPRPVLWVADEQTAGDHGLVLFPDGRVEQR